MKPLRIFENMLVVVTNLHHEGRANGLLGIVTEVDEKHRSAAVNAGSGYGCFQNISFVNLIPLIQLDGKCYNDPEEVFRDIGVLTKVIIRISVMVSELNRDLVERS